MVRLFGRASVNCLPLAIRTWIKHIPIVAPAQRWVVNRLLSRKAFVHRVNAGPARGLQFMVSLPKDKAVWSGTFESEVAEALKERVKAGDVCYDIGGYRGYMTGVLALSGASRVVVFDPLPENIVALRSLALLNPGFMVQIEQMAVGGSDGSAMFKVMPDDSMGKLAGSPFQMGSAASNEIVVKVRSLDTLVFKDGCPPPNLLKIDVEGAESDVLAGATKVLQTFHPKVLLEAHSEALANACSKQLMGVGYNVRQLERTIVDPELTRHLLADHL